MNLEMQKRPTEEVGVKIKVNAMNLEKKTVTNFRHPVLNMLSKV